MPNSLLSPTVVIRGRLRIQVRPSVRRTGQISIKKNDFSYQVVVLKTKAKSSSARCRTNTKWEKKWYAMATIFNQILHRCSLS